MIVQLSRTRRGAERRGYVPQALTAADSSAVVLVGHLAGGCHRQSGPRDGCPSVGLGPPAARVAAVGWRHRGADHRADDLATCNRRTSGVASSSALEVGSV